VSTYSPRQILKPSYGVDILLSGPMSQSVVSEIEHAQLTVDEERLWQKFKIAV